MRYVHVKPSHMTPLTLAKDTDAVRGAKVCVDCVHYADATGGIDVLVQERSAGRHGLNFVQGCSVATAKKELLEALAPAVTNDLFLGSVRSEEGRELKAIRTFRARRSIIVRGEKHPALRACPSCGRLCYFAMGKSYLFPPPATEVPVFDSGLGGLVIREDYFDATSFPKFSGVSIEKIGVAAAPLDGFGNLEEPNKAPEPTPGSVTPRAIEGVSK